MSIVSWVRFRAGLVAFSVLAATCALQGDAAPPKAPKFKHEVGINEREISPGRFNAAPDVDPVVVGPYDPADPGAHVVIWTYKHKATSLHIDGLADALQPACPADMKTCTWSVPAGLLGPNETTKKFKYTIRGKHDDGTDLQPNDPWIEVDR